MDHGKEVAALTWRQQKLGAGMLCSVEDPCVVTWSAIGAREEYMCKDVVMLCAVLWISSADPA